jgi:hypothetical protein
VRITGKFLTCWSFSILLAASTSQAQGISEKSIPLGDALNRALEKSSLTKANDKPFHMRIHLVESTNPPSDYRAEIEEYWLSPQQWRRSIDSPLFKQIVAVDGTKTSEKDTGDYFPLWLQNFVTAIFDPIPNAQFWNNVGAKITQITLPNGQHSDACVREKFRVGSDSVKNDAFSSLCFDADGMIGFFGSPGYSMEFHDYKSFGKKRFARRYQDDPEPGTEIVAKVVLLEDLTKPDPSLFALGESTPVEQRIRSIPVTQNLIEQAALNEPEIKWPPVHSGNTTGFLTMYVSVDRSGHIREAYPLNSDNAGLQDAARDQLLKWRLKPAVADGVPVQVEAAVSFRFSTTLADAQSRPPAPTSSGP